MLVREVNSTVNERDLVGRPDGLDLYRLRLGIERRLETATEFTGNGSASNLAALACDLNILLLYLEPPMNEEALHRHEDVHAFLAENAERIAK